MLKLSNATYTKGGILVIRDDELEAFAYAQLKDYEKNYFKTPHALDVDDFVENYLQRKVVYYKLSLDKSVLGITAISDGKISVVDSNNKLKAVRLLSCNTGFHPQGFAQHLANALGKPVYAPNMTIHSYSNGTHWISDNGKKENS